MFRRSCALVAIAATLMLVVPIGYRLAAATGNERIVFDPPVSGPAWTESGQWRRKIQQVFDARTRTLMRRAYEVWDPEPSRDLDFVWTPDRPDTDRPGPINGSGHLVWRVKGLPSYDRESVFAEYRGAVRNGRIEGLGAYLDKAGLLYDGAWRAGMMHGQGTLKLPSGDEYVGAFRRGKANGTGRYIDVTGEVFYGSFVEGERHGRGTTTLPSGAKYASVWVAGKEAEPSRQNRLAQAGGKGASGGADDIRLGITIDKRIPPSKDGDRRPPGDLFFSVTNSQSGLSIQPESKRLLSVWKGGAELQLIDDEDWKNGDVFGLFSFSRPALVPLKLNVEVQNRSSSMVQIKGAYIAVNSSAVEARPALQVSEETAFTDSNWLGFYRPFFHVENFGWSAAERATLSYSFVSEGSKTIPASPQHTRSIEKLERSIRIDLEPLLRSSGVNVDLLRANSMKGIRCKAKSLSACFAEQKAKGTFGNLANVITAPHGTFVLAVAGRFEYSWQDNKGVQRKGASPFRQRIFLGRPHEEDEMGEGGNREVVSATALKLQVDASNYRIPVSFRTDVPTGRAGRLIIPIEAEKASQHKFDIVVQLSDGREVRSRPIDLLYFRPRWIRPTFGIK